MIFSPMRSTAQVNLKPEEQALIRAIVLQFQNSLDILSEPHHNRLSRQCNAILKRLG